MLIVIAINTLNKYKMRTKETVPIAIKKFLLLYPIFYICYETKGWA